MTAPDVSGIYRSHFDMVCDFHKKFGVPVRAVPAMLPPDEHRFRLSFLYEEIKEYKESHEANDFTKQVDSLLDLIYVAYGTLALMGVNANIAMGIVHNANMQKVRAPSADASKEATGRGHEFDVIKPDGWIAPEPRLDLLIALYRVHRTDKTQLRKALAANFSALFPELQLPELQQQDEG